MAKKKATKTFDIDDAIEDAEAEAKGRPELHALAAPRGKAPAGTAAAAADLEPIRAKLEAASVGGLLSLLGKKFLKPLIEKYGDQIVQLIIDLINKKILGPLTPTPPAPTQ